MLTSEQLRVIYRLYKSVTCTAEFIFLTNMERVPQKRKDAELFFEEYGTGSINNHLLI